MSERGIYIPRLSDAAPEPQRGRGDGGWERVGWGVRSLPRYYWACSGPSFRAPVLHPHLPLLPTTYYLLLSLISLSYLLPLILISLSYLYPLLHISLSYLYSLLHISLS